VLAFQPAYSEWSRFEEGVWMRIKAMKMDVE
jgi:hypothetical protein